MHVDDAEVGHARLAAARDNMLAHVQRVVGGREKGVAAAIHRRRARVVGLALEDHARAAHPHDRLDDTDRDARLFESSTLLDVELDVGVHGARGHACLGRAVSVESGAGHRVDEPHAVDGRHLVDPGVLEHAAERPRAEEASVSPFLVAPRRDNQRPSVASARLGDRLDALEPGEDPEGPVEDAALRNRVDVRAGDDRRSFRKEGADAGRAESVAGRIDPRLEPRRAHLAEEPGAGFLVRRRPAHARHAAPGQATEPSERVDPRGESRQRDGDHCGTEYKP